MYEWMRKLQTICRHLIGFEGIFVCYLIKMLAHCLQNRVMYLFVNVSPIFKICIGVLCNADMWLFTRFAHRDRRAIFKCKPKKKTIHKHKRYKLSGYRMFTVYGNTGFDHNFISHTIFFSEISEKKLLIGNVKNK